MLELHSQSFLSATNRHCALFWWCRNTGLLVKTSKIITLYSNTFPISSLGRLQEEPVLLDLQDQIQLASTSGYVYDCPGRMNRRTGSPCLSGTSDRQTEFLLDISKTLFMTLLIVFLVEFEPPEPRAVDYCRDWNRYYEKNPEVGRCHRLSRFGIEVEHIVHAEEAL